MPLCSFWPAQGWASNGSVGWSLHTDCIGLLVMCRFSAFPPPPGSQLSRCKAGISLAAQPASGPPRSPHAAAIFSYLFLNVFFFPSGSRMPGGSWFPGVGLRGSFVSGAGMCMRFVSIRILGEKGRGSLVGLGWPTSARPTPAPRDQPQGRPVGGEDGELGEGGSCSRRLVARVGRGEAAAKGKARQREKEGEWMQDEGRRSSRRRDAIRHHQGPPFRRSSAKPSGLLLDRAGDDAKQGACRGQGPLPRGLTPAHSQPGQLSAGLQSHPWRRRSEDAGRGPMAAPRGPTPRDPPAAGAGSPPPRRRGPVRAEQKTAGSGAG